MTLGSALLIGVAQALALIPGTSRSGVTMTAGRFLGFTRPGLRALLVPARHSRHGRRHRVLDRRCAGERRQGHAWTQLLCAALTFVAGILAIAFLMKLLKRISFLPFVLYRMVLGGFLLVLLYS